MTPHLTGLYVITDGQHQDVDELTHKVAAALRGGARLVQYRDKSGDPLRRLDQAAALRALCRDAGVPLIVNDDVELARVIGADGVHLGQTDLPIAEARKIVGFDQVIGVSTANIEQARAALAQGLAFLDPEDRFNVLEFNSDTRALFEESMPALPWYQEQAVDFIADLEADGGTNMGPALELAMALPAQDGLLRQIVFVTDGSVGNERELLLQVGERLGASRLFTVSIGPAPNAWFMRKAAAIGRGSHTHIGQLDEVAERMASLWDRIALPAVQNVCVDWGMEAEFYPEVIPDLYAGEPLWLYARLPLEPREVLVCGALEGRYWETATQLLPGAGTEATGAPLGVAAASCPMSTTWTPSSVRLPKSLSTRRRNPSGDGGRSVRSPYTELDAATTGLPRLSA